MKRSGDRAFVFCCGMTLCAVVLAAEVVHRPAGVGIFSDSGQSLGNSTTQAVAAADLDGDTDLDVFAANSGANRVWLNDGSGQFSDSGQALGSASSRGVALANLDGDSDIDAVVANTNAPNQVWWNDGNGNFSAGPTFPSSSSRGVAVGELNGDTDLDIYIAETGADHIYTNNGDGTFSDSGQSLDGDDGYAVALEDLDGDGDLDAFVANGGGTGAFDRVWTNQGGDQGGTEGVFLDSGQTLGFIWTEDVALGNLDGNPGLDAFTASWFAPANKVWLNNASGGFVDSGQDLGMEGSLGVSLGDVDGDLDLDAFVGNNVPDGGKLWLNDGTGAFTDSGQAIGANVTISGSALADFNNDSRPDLFLAVFGPNQVWFNAAGVPVPPTVGFQPQIVDPRADAGESTSIALDADGNPHIAYTRHQLHRQGLDYGIWYARWDGVRWLREQVTLVDHIGGNDPSAVALVLDSAGDPHIAFVEPTTISYARRVGGVWQIQQVVDGQLYRNRIAMALDGGDNPHIVNYNSETGSLVYYRLMSGNWFSELIDPNIADDLYPDIVLDAADNPHVSYYHFGDQAIRYAQKTSGNWQSEIVEAATAPQDFPFTSIALDNGGNPAIAYNWNDEREIKLARRVAATWSTQTVRTVQFTIALEDQNDLAFDAAGNPQIVFAADNNAYIELTHAFWDGAQWVFRVIDDGGRAGGSASMALDGDDDLHVSYYDETHEDLRYVSWGPEYQTRIVDAGAAAETLALGLRDGSPSIGFYDVTSGLVKVTEWADAWLPDNISFYSNAVSEISAITRSGTQHFSYYDPDNQRLIYTRWNGGIDRVVVVDEVGDVGRFNDITFVEDNSLIRIAYWDATNFWVRLAELNGLSQPVLHVNDQSPALNAASGYLSITRLPDRNIGISYYDGVNGDLRYAAWDSGTNTWADQLVDGATSEAGRMNDIAVDGTDGVPVMAYHDETAGAIKLASGNGAGFDIVTAAPNVAGVTSLSLSLDLDSSERARILYTGTDGNLYLAARDDGLWRITDLGAASTQDKASLVLEDRVHFAYADSTDGLIYGFKASNIEFAELPGDPPMLGGGYYNPMDGCLAVLDLFTGGGDDLRAASGSTKLGRRGPVASGVTGPLTDPEVFDAMATLFEFTAGGQFYIGLYQSHGAEMGQIALNDPGLLWDSYGMMQTFMPGLEALVTGSGDNVLIEQAMVDQALDIWTRLAAAAGPGLAGTIGTELAKYNNLQDFVGLSFDEWAQAIGVTTPTVLDTVFGDGFE